MIEDKSMKTGDLDITTRLDARCDKIEKWLEKNGPECMIEQRHLDEGSKERAYWHSGYLMAIKDVLALFGNANTTRH